MSVSLVVAVCVAFLLSVSLVSAACTQTTLPGTPGFPIGTPDQPRALVMYILSVPVTPGSSTSLGGGTFSGLAGADQLCTENQPNSVDNPLWTHVSQPRVAILSASNQNARERFATNVEIVNVKGECIAANANELFNGLILADVLYTEDGTSVADESTAWTATNPDGSKYGLGSSGINTATDTHPEKYCNDWTSSSTTGGNSATAVGVLDTSADTNSKWVTFGISTDALCNTPRYIYCISAAEAPTPQTITGDPQFVGLQGQEFQVHGIPEEYFALVSHPFFALNSHFTYLASGHCHYNDTACWTHPGTYVDQLGLMLPGYEIAVMAGTHDQGLRVSVNGKHLMDSHTGTGTGTRFPIRATFPLSLDNDTIAAVHNLWLEPSTTDINTAAATAEPTSWLASASIQISWVAKGHVIIETPVATVDIYNAEHFFNFQLEFHAPRLLLAGAPLHRVSHTKSAHAHVAPAEAPHPAYPMHGLVGQTWKNVKYPHGRLYAGEVDDYMLADRRLFSTSFVFNEYQY